MSRQLFGTDGIRGVAGQYPLDDQTVQAFGLALGDWARQHAADPEVLIGMDTRESGPRIAAMVASALRSQGVRARFLGVITTPGVAYLTKTTDVVAGLMVSASHNPFEDNGLKVFAHTGYKLPDSEELELEKAIFAYRDDPRVLEPLLLTADTDLVAFYLESLIKTSKAGLQGMRLVMDCGNGAASFLAPALFQKLGAEVIAMHCGPDGRNINLKCGATHLESLVDRVISEKADAGIAFDGDADRCMMVSSSGKLIDGDHTLLIAAKMLRADGRLKDGEPIVATVMSNMGLEVALKGHRVGMLRANVGDKYVLEMMQEVGSPIGGEQSGHVIFSDFATTGDGMLTALQILVAARTAEQSLDDMTSEFQIFPQKLVNVRVKEKRPLAELPMVRAAIQDAETAFDGRGRVLVRFSGTEPLLRVMVEGAEAQMVDHWVHRIADVIQQEMN